MQKKSFTFLHGIGQDRLRYIRDSYLTNGLETRVHGNSKWLPHNHLTHTAIFVGHANWTVTLSLSLSTSRLMRNLQKVQWNIIIIQCTMIWALAVFINKYSSNTFVRYLLQAIKAAEEHLEAVAKERSKYRSACKDSKSNLVALFTSNGTFLPPPPDSAVPPLCHDKPGMIPGHKRDDIKLLPSSRS